MKAALVLILINTIILAINASSSPKQKCPPNQEWRECQSSSCSDLPCNTTPPTFCTADCQTGCFCSAGFERNQEKECVACPKTCRKNEVWTDCIDPCRSQSCSDVRPTEPIKCIKKCNGLGCICEGDLRRNEKYECVKC